MREVFLEMSPELSPGRWAGFIYAYIKLWLCTQLCVRIGTWAHSTVREMDWSVVAIQCKGWQTMASGSNPENHLFLYGSWAENDFYKARRDGYGVSHQCFLCHFKPYLGPLSGPLDKDIVFYGFKWQHTHGEHRRDTEEKQLNLPRKIREITPRRGNTTWTNI